MFKSSPMTIAPEACARMTTYFCRKVDPQRKVHVAADDISYIEPWYYSVDRLRLPGIVFHDGMSKQFIERFGTDLIRFVYVPPERFAYSVNDYRFVIYHEYLTDHPEIEFAFMTDGNDVQVVQNPFEQIRPDRLYVGSEPEYIQDSRWLQRRIWQLNEGLGSRQFRTWRWRKQLIYNAGLLGGNRGLLLEFLGCMKDTFASLGPEHRELNLNMAAFNDVVYERFRRRCLTGPPIHSVYKNFENDRRDVWFIHK